MDIYNKDNEHLFLEEIDNTDNSFIANLNLLAKNIDNIKFLNNSLNEELVKAINELAGVEIQTLTEDLLKGSANGERQLGINLLNNIMGIGKDTNPVDAAALWNDPTVVVSYNKAIITLIDGGKYTLNFSIDGSPINIKTNIELYQQLVNSEEFMEVMYGTSIHSVPTPVVYEQISILDMVGETSNIHHIDLYAVSGMYKQQIVTYNWDETTSALKVLATNYKYVTQVVENIAKYDVLVDALEKLKNLNSAVPFLVGTFTNGVLDDDNTVYKHLDTLIDISNNMSELLQAARDAVEAKTDVIDLIDDAQDKINQAATLIQNATWEVRGYYQNTETYNKNDIVYLDLSAYISLINDNTDPLSIETSWLKMYELTPPDVQIATPDTLGGVKLGKGLVSNGEDGVVDVKPDNTTVFFNEDNELSIQSIPEIGTSTIQGLTAFINSKVTTITSTSITATLGEIVASTLPDGYILTICNDPTKTIIIEQTGNIALFNTVGSYTMKTNEPIKLKKMGTTYTEFVDTTLSLDSRFLDTTLKKTNNKLGINTTNLPSSTYLGKTELSIIPPSKLPKNGWYLLGGDTYPINSTIGQRLVEISQLDYMQEFLKNCPIKTNAVVLNNSAIDRFPAMTSNTTPSPYKVVPSIEHPSELAYKAFNKNVTTEDAWLGFTTTTEPETASISFSFGSTQHIALTKYNMRSRNHATGIYLPVGWHVYVGESPNTAVDDWVLVDTQQSTFTTYNQLKSFTVKWPVIAPTGKVKITFISDNSNKVAMGEIYLLTDTWTTQAPTEISLPNWSVHVPDYIGKGGVSAGGIVMPFMRPISGARQVGSVERDATRKITGAIDRPDSAPNYFNSGFCAIANNIFLGILSSTRRGGNFQVATGGTTNFQSQMLDINSSNVVPTGPENTVTNRGMTPVIYLGV